MTSPQPLGEHAQAVLEQLRREGCFDYYDEFSEEDQEALTELRERGLIRLEDYSDELDGSDAWWYPAPVSNCCKAVVLTKNLGRRFVTPYYVCTSCGRRCDAR